VDFVTPEVVSEALRARTPEGDLDLGQFLVAQGRLTPARRRLLDALVQEHLQAHDPPGPAAGTTPDDRTDVEATGPYRGQSQDAALGGADLAPLRYRVLHPHARGGLGEVFVALDQELRRRVALKEIQPRHAHDPGNRLRFLREARITGALEHPDLAAVARSLRDGVQRRRLRPQPGRCPPRPQAS
jgi:hypothetical protein